MKNHPKTFTLPFINALDYDTFDPTEFVQSLQLTI